ncbi:MAG: hypothetical protein HUJ56_10310 [Erysipelotrichaceae bacterium]|nr:hypothetical protein [Erysipelotrichaceae bacterium]
MNKLKTIFYHQNLTWIKLILFSITCGVITGIIPTISFFTPTSIHNIAVCFEMWVLLAMFIILNSKKPLEAGLKTFVFFLISQPLCYLVQVPFYYDGFGIFRYYPYWAVLTVLTFPGAMVAWYIKKENWLSVGLLSIVLSLLSFELVEHFVTLMKSFPYQLLAVLFILLEIILFIPMIFKEKNKRITLYAITVVLLIIAATSNYVTSHSRPDNVGFYVFEEVTEYTLVEKDDNVKVEITDSYIKASTKENGTYTILVQDKEGTMYEYILTVKDAETSLELVE